MVRGERKAGFDQNGVSQNSPRMSKFAGAIMNANQLGRRPGKRKEKAKEESSEKKEKPWYLSTTPDHLQVPTNKLHQERWVKKVLDLNKEKETLDKIRPNWKYEQAASSWPDDAPDERSPEGRSVMCAHKLMAAKELSVIQHQVAVAKYKAWRSSEFANKLESEKIISAAQQAYLALGLTEFEVSMDKYEKANKSLARMRRNASFRPQDGQQPDSVLPIFDRLRDRYNLNRGRETLRLMERIGFDFQRNTFSRGGPAENRTTKKIEDENPEPNFEEEDFSVVLSPSSPLGYQLLRAGKKRPPKFLGDEPEEVNGLAYSVLEPRNVGDELDKANEDRFEVESEAEAEEDSAWQNTMRIAARVQVQTDEEQLAIKQHQTSFDLSRPAQRREPSSSQGRVAIFPARESNHPTSPEQKRSLTSRAFAEPFHTTRTSPRQTLSPRDRLQPLRSSSPPPQDEEYDKEVHIMSEFMKAACKYSADSPSRRVLPFNQGLGRTTAGGQAPGAGLLPA